MKSPKQNLSYLLISVKKVRRFRLIHSGPAMMLQVISEYKITLDSNLEIENSWRSI